MLTKKGCDTAPLKYARELVKQRSRKSNRLAAGSQQKESWMGNLVDSGVRTSLYPSLCSSIGIAVRHVAVRICLCSVRCFAQRVIVGSVDSHSASLCWYSRR